MIKAVGRRWQRRRSGGRRRRWRRSIVIRGRKPAAALAKMPAVPAGIIATIAPRRHGVCTLGALVEDEVMK